MIISDSITVDASGLTVTKDGYLAGMAKIARAGNVQYYLGKELGLTGDDAEREIGVYRDPETVFDKDSMMSLAGRPVTRNHPDTPVTADNWKDLSKGYVGGTVARDGDFVVAPMAIMDSAAVKEVMDGAKSLSAGYTCTVVKDSGTTSNGEAYEYRQEGPLRFNHVAYLPSNNPRAKGAKLGDNDAGGAKFVDNAGVDNDGAKLKNIDKSKGGNKVELKTVVLGDAAVSVEAKDVDVVEKFKGAHVKAVSEKDKQIGELSAKLKLAEDAAANLDIDKLVAERSEFIAHVKSIDDSIAINGKTEVDIMKEVVSKKLGAELVKDASDDMVRGMFLTLSSVKDNAVNTAFKVLSTDVKDAKDAQVSYINRMTGKKGA